MGTGILLVAYTLSFPVYQWFCSVCVKIVAKGLLAFYAAALLVCYDLSFDVPISPNLERGCSFDEPKAACLFFSSIFYGIYRSPKSVLLGKIHFNKQLWPAVLCFFVFDRSIFQNVSCQEDKEILPFVLYRRLCLCDNMEDWDVMAVCEIIWGSKRRYHLLIL